MQNNYKNNLFFDKYTYLIMSIFIYSFFEILFSIYQIDFFRLFQIISILIFIVITYNLVIVYLNKNRHDITFSLFLLWQIFIIIRLENFNLDELRLLIFDKSHFLSYLVPFIALLPLKLYNINKVFYSYIFFSISILLLNFYLISEFPINNFTDLIALSCLPPAGILLLLSKYTNRKITIAAFFVVVSILIIGLIYGRRTVVSNTMLFLIFSFLINIIINKKYSNIFKAFSLLIVSVFCVLLIDYFIKNANSNTFQIFSRVEIDSRSDIISAFTKDFKLNDYLIGRGIDGKYYNPIKYWNYNNEDYREVDYRSTIENGFLYLILKGGAVWLLLFLTIMFRAIYFGVFKTNNLFTKALSCYLIIYFVEMFTYGQPLFSIKYFLVWICISICHSHRFRMIDDKQIIKLISYNKFKRIKRIKKHEFDI